VPLTLARMPAGTEFGIFEIGMSNSFEILPLTGFVKPEIAIVTTVAPVHLAQFPSLSAIADAKGEIFSGLVPGGIALINRDISEFDRLKAHAAASPAGRIITFGEHASADVRLVDGDFTADYSDVTAQVLGRTIRFRLGTPGRHLAQNALAVMAAVKLAGADMEAAGQALAGFVPTDGRGKRISLAATGGVFTLLDESYNANPSSMRAALQVLGTVPTGKGGRRIAVLGDMLELGDSGAALHANLAESVEKAGVDLVFCSGPLTKSLFDALPPARRGGYAADSAALEPQVLDAIQAGDVVTVKGSNGSRMARIVAALKARYPEETGAAGATNRG